MNSFTFEAHIPRTLFGSGTITQIASEVERLAAKHVLIVTEKTDRQMALAEKVKGTMPSRVAGVSVEPCLLDGMLS
jgi:alcohol dehydrogenase class IV